MSIRCGNHTEPTYHDTVSNVRACFAGAVGGEPTYGDVILTAGEQAKIAAGIREMEDEGILPRSNSQTRWNRAGMDGMAETVATIKAGMQEMRTSSKGRDIPEGYGGSPKQYDYLFELNEQLENHYETLAGVESVRQASAEIDKLKTLLRDRRRMALSDREPAVARREPVRQTVTNSGARVTEDGIYRNRETGELFKVQVAVHGSGNLYAKQAVIDTLHGSETRIPLSGDEADDMLDAVRIVWQYRPGMINKIDPAWRLTWDEALAFGALYGQCVRCGRTLTKESSIEAAIGPVCAGKLQR